MLNRLFDNSGFNDVESILMGHHKFMLKNKGTTYDATQQHYVTNESYVLSNNRHFIAATQMEAQPNGDGTTEGQSLQIIGYCYAYIATGNPVYLEAAENYFNAYIDHFYYGQPIPTEVGRYISNWLVNSKEPVLSNWPIDFEEPTHSGFKGEMMTFSNGQCLIPHGAPYWGEYLDKATFAFDGALGWDSIVATVYGLDTEGDTDWDSYGTQYDVDWLINYQGNKIDWDGNNIGSGFPVEQYGTVQLKDTTVNGQHKLNWANCQPVEHGGYMLERNRPWHNRPLRVPVATIGSDGRAQYNQMGNASDAEQWFADAAYLLWKITGEDKYHMVYQCVLFTVNEYAEIDSKDKFFRQSTLAQIPYTDGISYDFAYPSDAVRTYTRDADGYIVARVEEKAQLSLEQQAIWFRVNQNSKIRTTYGGLDDAGNPLSVRIQMVLGLTKEDQTGLPWIASLPASTAAMQTYDLPLGSLVRETKDDGTPYLLADARAISEYSGTTYETVYEDNIYGMYSGNTIRAHFPNDDAGMDIGFYYLEQDRQPVNSILYRSTGEFDMRLSDDNNWRWYWILENTNGQWVNKQLNAVDMHLSYYQPNHDDSETRPTAPVLSTVDQVTLLMENSGDVNLDFQYYVINDLPVRYELEDGYTFKYRITISGDEAFTAKIGDCTVIDYRNDSLAYTPGVIPFSNIYEEGVYEIGAWHGMPYPGYQYPFIYVYDYTKETELNNMIDFMYDSQEAYHSKFGVYGPGMSAYIWNRWDNYKYGDPDTWTMYHWGDDHAWAGYQPRAFHGAARAWYEMVTDGRNVNAKLVTYIDRWIDWLYQFMVDSKGVSPTEFPMESLPVPVPDDFTGHMCGLWMAGACFAALAGSSNPKVHPLIEMLVREMFANYKVTDVPGHVMNGAWSPALRLDTGSGPESNGMFFGFWSGEILRGLSMYMIYKKLNPGENMYQKLIP